MSDVVFIQNVGKDKIGIVEKVNIEWCIKDIEKQIYGWVDYNTVQAGSGKVSKIKQEEVNNSEIVKGTNIGFIESSGQLLKSLALELFGKLKNQV